MPLDQHRGTGGLGDDLAEEVGHRRDVAVDALDQLAGSVRAMELVVEAEHVTRHRETQAVGRSPRGDGCQPGNDHGDELRARCDRQEDQGESGDLRRGGAVGGGVDDATDDQRPRDRECRADRHEHAEADPTPHVGPQQRAESTPTRTGRTGLRRHPDSLAAEPDARQHEFPSTRLSGPHPIVRLVRPSPTLDARSGNVCERNEVDRRDGCAPTQPRGPLRPRRRDVDAASTATCSASAS